MKKAAITIIISISIILGSCSLAFAEETAPDISELEARIEALEEENASIKAIMFLLLTMEITGNCSVPGRPARY